MPRKMEDEIDGVIEKLSVENREHEKSLVRYGIVGNLGAIIFILNRMSSDSSQGMEVIDLDSPLISFSVSFIFSLAYLVVSFVLGRLAYRRALALLHAQLEFDEQQLETSEFDESVIPFNEKRKAAMRRLSVVSVWGNILLGLFLLLIMSTFLFGFIRSIFYALNYG